MSINAEEVGKEAPLGPCLCAQPVLQPRAGHAFPKNSSGNAERDMDSWGSRRRCRSCRKPSCGASTSSSNHCPELCCLLSQENRCPPVIGDICHPLGDTLSLFPALPGRPGASPPRTAGHLFAKGPASARGPASLLSPSCACPVPSISSRVIRFPPLDRSLPGPFG